MPVRKEKEEKPSPLGDRVYKNHRRMLSALAKVLKVSRAQALRNAIEESYSQYVVTR